MPRGHLLDVARNTSLAADRKWIKGEDMDSGRRGELLRKSISLASVRIDGSYTVPRSYGVYRLSASKDRGCEYRFGNHPVRQQELVRDYGAAPLEALFADRDDAWELARILNDRDR
jgi:hypothetical protein